MEKRRRTAGASPGVGPSLARPRNVSADPVCSQRGGSSGPAPCPAGLKQELIIKVCWKQRRLQGSHCFGSIAESPGLLLSRITPFPRKTFITPIIPQAPLVPALQRSATALTRRCHDGNQVSLPWPAEVGRDPRAGSWGTPLWGGLVRC